MIYKIEEGQERSKEEVLKSFDEEVEKFSLYLGALPEDSLGRGPLSTAEKALIKSYLVAKYRGRV